jgi:hypothetical protein
VEEHFQGHSSQLGMNLSIPPAINGLLGAFTYLNMDWISSLKNLSFPKILDGSSCPSPLSLASRDPLTPEEASSDGS